MSSPDRTNSRRARRALALAAAFALPLLAACTVQPLYAVRTGSIGDSVASDLSSISIAPVETRVAQEVRNHLTFLLTGGAERTTDPRYVMTLNVSSAIEATAVVQVAKENEPTAGTLTLTAEYEIKDTTGERIAKGKRNISSSFDIPRQEFAALRAARDAENRAARELAEVLRSAVAQDLRPRV